MLFLHLCFNYYILVYPEVKRPGYKADLLPIRRLRMICAVPPLHHTPSWQLYITTMYFVPGKQAYSEIRRDVYVYCLHKHGGSRRCCSLRDTKLTYIYCRVLHKYEGVICICLSRHIIKVLMVLWRLRTRHIQDTDIENNQNFWGEISCSCDGLVTQRTINSLAPEFQALCTLQNTGI